MPDLSRQVTGVHCPPCYKGARRRPVYIRSIKPSTPLYSTVSRPTIPPCLKRRQGDEQATSLLVGFDDVAETVKPDSIRGTSGGGGKHSGEIHA